MFKNHQHRIGPLAFVAMAAVDARPFWRDKEVSPSGAGYHYNHNAETYMEVGNALGRAMAELLQD